MLGSKMNDLRIDACSWHVDREAPEHKQRALENFRDRYTVLLRFLASEGLLTDTVMTRRLIGRHLNFDNLT